MVEGWSEIREGSVGGCMVDEATRGRGGLRSGERRSIKSSRVSHVLFLLNSLFTRFEGSIRAGVAVSIVSIVIFPPTDLLDRDFRKRERSCFRFEHSSASILKNGRFRRSRGFDRDLLADVADCSR